MTTPQRAQDSRWLVVLLAALTAVLALLLPATPASAAAPPAAETRVGASTVATAVVVGVHECITAGQRPVRGPSQPQIVSGNCVAAKAGDGATGIVYRRTDVAGGKPYIGQSKSDPRYIGRQSEHARANPDADFDFEIIGRAKPGAPLDRLEEFYIRQGGGPTNLSNPNGGLANRRHQMNDQRYRGAGGDLP